MKSLENQEAKLENLAVYGRASMGESWLLDYYRFGFLPMFFGHGQTETWLLESCLSPRD